MSYISERVKIDLIDVTLDRDVDFSLYGEERMVIGQYDDTPIDQSTIESTLRCALTLDDVRYRQVELKGDRERETMGEMLTFDKNWIGKFVGFPEVSTWSVLFDYKITYLARNPLAFVRVVIFPEEEYPYIRVFRLEQVDDKWYISISRSDSWMSEDSGSIRYNRLSKEAIQRIFTGEHRGESAYLELLDFIATEAQPNIIQLHKINDFDYHRDEYDSIFNRKY
ncbi:MAG TPA: hypothetical protein VJ951_16080 [Bacteroidales bacterium]|nr:hypothetical protein [Bacteroidales bacterium]